jgi:poly(beta-D-mannuronate) lyase
MKSSEWLDYPINVSTAGNYVADVRVASQKSTGKFTLSIDGSQVGSEQSVAQDDWQNWDTETVDVGFLSAGNHTLRLNVTGSDMNVNWIELKTADVNPTGCNIDMTIWGYTLGNGVSQNDQSDIQDLVNNVDLGGDELTWDDGCPTFKVGNDASSSSGSSYARSELRELLTRYSDSGPGVKDIENNWVTSNYTNSDVGDAGGVDGTMNATLKVNTVSVDRVSSSSSTKDDQVGRIIVGQIHGVDHEPVKIYYQKHPDHTNGSVYFTVDGSSGSPVDRVYVIGYSDKDYAKHVNGSETLSNPANGIPLGDEWSYEIDLTGDQLRVTIWHDGNVYTTADAIAYSKTQSRAMLSNSGDTNAITISDYYDDDWMYFKAGLYNQNNSGVQSPNYSSVTFYAIDVQH